MNRNGTIIIIHIYLMASQFGFSLANYVDRNMKRNGNIEEGGTTRAIPSAGSGSLYSNFNNRLDGISNYAACKFYKELSTSMGKIYELNAERLLREVQQTQHHNHSEQRPNEIEKANNADELDKTPDGYGKMINAEIYGVSFPAVERLQNFSHTLDQQAGHIHSNSKLSKRIPLLIPGSCHNSSSSLSYPFSPTILHSLLGPAATGSSLSPEKRGSILGWQKRTKRHESSRASKLSSLPEKFTKPFESYSSRSMLSSRKKIRQVDLGRALGGQMIYDSHSAVQSDNDELDDGVLPLPSRTQRSQLPIPTRKGNVDKWHDENENDWKFGLNSNLIDVAAGPTANLLQRKNQNHKNTKKNIFRRNTQVNCCGAITGIDIGANGDSASSYPGVLTASLREKQQNLTSTLDIMPSTVLSGSEIKLKSLQEAPNKIKKNDAKDMDRLIDDAVNTLNNKENLPEEKIHLAPVGLPTANIGTLIPSAQQSPPPFLQSSKIRSLPGPDLTQNFTSVLEEVLMELDSLKECKMTSSIAGTRHPEGSPCDIFGSWNSQAIGLRFNIDKTEDKPEETPTRRAASQMEEAELNALTIVLKERTPSKRHELMDCNWRCKGSTQKRFGGPFYVYAQNPEGNSLATFAGFCRTCGGVDTIFGSWTFVRPSKDCRDISVSIENKRDVLRRYTLDAKRKQRIEKLLKSKASKDINLKTAK